MSDFCTKCLEHENEIAKLREEKFQLQKQVDTLQNHVESLAFDVAFYSKSLNLSCDGN